MPSQSSFSGKPAELESKTLPDFLDELYDELYELLPEEEPRPRVERDFGGTNVFFQGKDYNVFAGQDKLVFSGLNASMAAYLDGKEYEWQDEESPEVLELLAEKYGIEDPINQINWY